MTDSQAITVYGSRDLAALNELETALLEGVAPAEVDRDPEEISQEIIRQLLAATDDEQLERLEAESWRDNVGKPYEIVDFIWRPSTFEEGQAVFLVVRAIDVTDGSPHVLTTGGGQVMAQLCNLARRDRLPTIRQLASAETKTGYTVYWLETPPAIAAARREQAAAERAAAAQAADDTDS